MYKKLFCAVLIAATAVSGCKKEPAAPETTLTPVETSTVVRTEIKNELIYAGQIKPSDKVSVASKISGKVAETFFDIGDFVSEGDVLFRLDEEDLRNQIRQLESQVNVASQGVNSAETALKSVTGGQYESQLLQQKTQIENAEKQLDTAGLAIENASIGLENSTIAMENANLALENASVTMENANLAIENAAVTMEKANLAISDAKTAFENAETSYNNAKILRDAGTISENDFDKAKLAYDQSKSGMEQAQLALEQAQLAYNQALLAPSQAQFTLDQAQLAVEQTKLTQSQAQVAYNQAGVQREQAAAAYQAAQEAYNLIQGSIVSDSVNQAQSGVSTAQASQQSAQVQLDIVRNSLKDTAVRSPMTGVINTKNITAGEFVSPQAAAYTIVNAETVSVDVKVSEVLINTLSVGDKVEIYINTIRPEPFDGTVTAISPAADATSTFPIKVNIANVGGLIKPGMFAEARFIREQSENAIVLPRNTILEDESSKYVYINGDGTAKKVVVTTGIDNGENIEILTGLTDNDEVITRGQSYVVDGEKINVVALNSGSEEAKE